MKNLEIKGTIKNRPEFEERVREVEAKYKGVIPQEDTYFDVKSGRLKVRMFDERNGELIYYDRKEEAGEERWSLWEAYPLNDPKKMIKILGESLGVRGRVVKERTLYTYKDARIHIDRVEGLGDFFEIESKVEKSKDEAAYTLEYLVEKLVIDRGSLLRRSYIDMMEK